MEYDPYDYETDKDPYPVYEYFRENEPLYYNEKFDFYALFRFRDVLAALMDADKYSSTGGVTLEDLPFGPMMIVQDAPDHMMTRGVVREYFSKPAIAAIEPVIREIVCEHLDELVGHDEVDAVGRFSSLFPMDVISSILGIPKEDRDEIRIASNNSLSRRPGEAMPPPESIKSALRSREMYAGYLADRRKNPKDDLMTVMISAEVDDVSAGSKRHFSEEELLGFCGLIAAAGSETLTKFFGNSLNALAKPENTAAREEIIADKECLPNAFEELLRYDPPTHYTVRTSTTDIEVAGGVIPKGKKVAMMIGSASRDPDEFDEPSKLDIHRNVSRQLALGFGRHLCLGSALVRMEGRIALEEWHKRFPSYEVLEDKVEWVHSSNVRGFSSLPVRIIK